MSVDPTAPGAPPSPHQPSPMQMVQKATRTKTNAIPRRVKKCMVCSHPDETEIMKARLGGMSHVDIAAQYFQSRTPKTALNALSKHFKKHINVQASTALLPSVIPASQGTNLSVSTQRVFNKEAKRHLNAQADIETIMGGLKERLNLLEDEFLAIHILGKCDHCGRGDSPFNDVNTKKFVDLVNTFNGLLDRWLKIKNPKAVIKYFFDSTFLKFVENMMSHYVVNLQEKGRLARQAVNEYAEQKISLQLLLRRITEVEDMGARTVAERGIIELRAIQEYIDKEFAKNTWGT